MIKFLTTRPDKNYESGPEDIEDTQWGVDVEQKIPNRAWVVTVFRREEFGFDMLFTGDAHDQEYDSKQSIARWKNRESTMFKFSVLKVPRHGSNNTTQS